MPGNHCGICSHDLGKAWQLKRARSGGFDFSQPQTYGRPLAGRITAVGNGKVWQVRQFVEMPWRAEGSEDRVAGIHPERPPELHDGVANDPPGAYQFMAAGQEIDIDPFVVARLLDQLTVPGVA